MTLQICTLKGVHMAWIHTSHNNTSTSILITILNIVGAMNPNMLGLFSLEDALHAPQWTITQDWWEQVNHAAHSPGPSAKLCPQERMLFQCFERWVFWCQYPESHIQLALSEYADKPIPEFILHDLDKSYNHKAKLYVGRYMAMSGHEFLTMVSGLR